jgi:hypothetical protein
MSTENTSIATGLSAMFQAAQTGGDLRSAFNSPDSVQPAPEPSQEAPEEGDAEVVEASEQSEESSQSPSESQDSEVEKVSAESKSDIEEITITDSKGKRTLKVDFSDRDKLKKMVQLAAGARKWQQERDLERAERAKEREEAKKLTEDMGKFEKAYGQGGYEGVKNLVELLEGSGSFDKFLEQATAERDRWDSMTESERREVEFERKQQSEQSRLKELESKYESKLAELTSRQEQAEVKSLESKLHPAFDRYRFAGKLNDPVAEQRLDRALWSQAMESLEAIPENVEITQAMIEKEFRKAAADFSSAVNKQVNQKVQKVIRTTKEDATRKAQATVNKSMKSSGAADQFRKDISQSGSGGLASALRAMVEGRVKLK